MEVKNEIPADLKSPLQSRFERLKDLARTSAEACCSQEMFDRWQGVSPKEFLARSANQHDDKFPLGQRMRAAIQIALGVGSQKGSSPEVALFVEYIEKLIDGGKEKQAARVLERVLSTTDHHRKFNYERGKTTYEVGRALSMRESAQNEDLEMALQTILRREPEAQLLDRILARELVPPTRPVQLLSIRNSQISNIAPIIEMCPDLKVLYLSGSRVSRIPLEIKKLRCLQVLRLTGLPIEDFEPLKACRNLQTLGLAGCTINNKDILSATGPIAQVQRLDLRGARIASDTEEDYAALLELPNLYHLRLSPGQKEKAGTVIAALEKKNVKVVYEEFEAQGPKIP